MHTLEMRRNGVYAGIGPDANVVLKPRGRVKRYNGHAVAAFVYLGTNDVKAYQRAFHGPDTYRHPEVRIGTLGYDGTIDQYRGMDIGFEAQMHAHTRSTDVPERGFLVSPGWSGVYGLQVRRADVDGRSRRKSLCRAIEIVGDASEAGSLINSARWDRIVASKNTRPRVNVSEFTQLILGFQAIGVRVVIRNASLQAIRARRECPDMPDTETEVASLIRQGERYGTGISVLTRDA